MSSCEVEYADELGDWWKHLTEQEQKVTIDALPSL